MNDRSEGPGNGTLRAARFRARYSSRCAQDVASGHDQKKRRGQRYTPKKAESFEQGRHLSAVPEDDEPELLQSVGVALRAEHPLEFLVTMSQIVELVNERPLDRLREDRSELISASELVDTFSGVDAIEIAAVLKAFTLFSNDELVRRKAAVELKHHSQRLLPAWLQQIDDLDVFSIWRISHVLPDGETFLIGLRWPGGVECTLLVHVDFNMGVVVKDASLIPNGVKEVLSRTGEEEDELEDSTTESFDLADARARISEAIEVAERTISLPESDTWPACRPLVDFILAKLPANGTGYERQGLSEDEQRAIKNEFLDSEFAISAEYDEAERDLVDLIIECFGNYGPCDPFRLSPVSIEIFLVDWVPRKVIAPKEHLVRIIDVLHAYLDFGHRKTGITARVTDETHRAIARWTPTFLEAIDDEDRPYGAEAIALAALQSLPGGNEWNRSEYMVSY